MSIRPVEQLIGDDSALAAAMRAAGRPYESRPQQLHLANTIRRGITKPTAVIGEGATGIGKTFTYLRTATDAVLDPDSWPKVVIVATGDKNLQGQLINSDVPIVIAAYEAEGYKVRATVLKGRGSYICRSRIEEHEDALTIVEDDKLDSITLSTAQPFADAAANRDWPRLLEWMATTKTGDFEDPGAGIEPFSKALINNVNVDQNSCTGKKCRFYNTCFAETHRHAAREAHIIIVNHALLLMALKIFFKTSYRAQLIPMPTTRNEFAGSHKIPAIVVIDEAHRLEDAATNAYSSEVRMPRIYWLRKRVERFTVKSTEIAGTDEEIKARVRAKVDSENLNRKRAAEIAKKVPIFVSSAEINEQEMAMLDAKSQAETVMATFNTVVYVAQRYFKRWEKRLTKQKPQKPIMISDDTARAAELIVALEQGKREIDSYPEPKWLDKKHYAAWNRLSYITKQLLADLEACIQPSATTTPDGRVINDNYIRYADTEGKAATLYAKPINVSTILRRQLWSVFPCVIATSATLATEANNFNAWLTAVGAPKDSFHVIVASPFDYKNRVRTFIPNRAVAGLYDPGKARTDAVYAEKYLQRVCDDTLRIIDIFGGGVLMLFTAKKQMFAVYDKLFPLLRDRYTVLIQDADSNRQHVTAAFKADGNAVLFAVASYWEGVDIPGYALRCVVIDKLPFPAPDDPLFDARKRAMTTFTGDSWAWLNKISVPHALIRLKQGYGRLMRHKDDWGVVCILDGRLRIHKYGGTMIAALPRAPRISSIERIEEFVTEFNDQRDIAQGTAS